MTRLKDLLRGRREDEPKRPLPQQADAIALGGRRFVQLTESTVEHDFRMMALLREVGLDRPMRLEDETPADYGGRLLRDLISSDRALDVLGHLLVPEGVAPRDWTVEMAKETAAFLGGLVHPDDKQRIYALTLEFLLGFFQLELDSLRRSPPSSGRTRSRAGKSGKRKRVVKRVVRMGTGRT